QWAAAPAAEPRSDTRRHGTARRRAARGRFVRIGTTNATSAGAAGVRLGPGSPVNRAADPQRSLRGGEGEGRHRHRPLPCAAVGWWSRGGQRGAAPAVGGSGEGGTEGGALGSGRGG